MKLLVVEFEILFTGTAGVSPAERAQHVSEVVHPLLARCDRGGRDACGPSETD